MKQKTNKSQKRDPNQKKIARSGQKSLRGVAETDYGELKGPHCFSLTPTCYANLQNLARQLECSVSEILERFSRRAVQFQPFLQSLETPEIQPTEEPSPHIEAESDDSPSLELLDLPEAPFNKDIPTGG